MFDFGSVTKIINLTFTNIFYKSIFHKIFFKKNLNLHMKNPCNLYISSHQKREKHNTPSSVKWTGHSFSFFHTKPTKRPLGKTKSSTHLFEYNNKLNNTFCTDINKVKTKAPFLRFWLIVVKLLNFVMGQTEAINKKKKKTESENQWRWVAFTSVVVVVLALGFASKPFFFKPASKSCHCSQVKTHLISHFLLCVYVYVYWVIEVYFLVMS